MERRDAEAQSLFFLREQSAQRVAFSSVFFAFSLNCSSASLRLCIPYSDFAGLFLLFKQVERLVDNGFFFFRFTFFRIVTNDAL